MPKMRLKTVQKRISDGHLQLRLSRHALQEAFRDAIAVAAIERISRTGTQVEGYPSRGRFLVMGFEAPGGRPIHVVLEPAGAECVVVTAYEPSAREWHKDWRSRR